MLFRLAPTPSGFLHIGNAVNFVLTWLAARQLGGRLLLRIDDLDATRKRPDYVVDIFETIHWLGLDYDLGPADPDDLDKQWSQWHRLDRYAETLEKLREVNALYTCSLSRHQWQELDATDNWQSLDRTGDLFHEEDIAWRFRAPGNGSADFVVRRRDGLPAYQIASLTDDQLHGVTHIIRGQDLAESTTRQAQLAKALGWTDFLDTAIWHHPLLLDQSGQKMSKSAGHGHNGPTSVRAMREAGENPSRIFEAVAELLQLPCETSVTLPQLLTCSIDWDVFFRTIGTVNKP
ncbi:glutamate--tRNA ligase [Fibrella sp. HMF5335]|uniref:Glutamate--tRNA ligase n=1 Tax=Fibrella rubiginis TaxID=2817060 RepID=A0A939K3X8_9BACT|nr:glutamate--tRNA ligase family protein [Fibrella rubiginis]MBO0936098.1 glutamate--tRNA ligase [Fibrella rubiginis]